MTWVPRSIPLTENGHPVLPPVSPVLGVPKMQPIFQRFQTADEEDDCFLITMAAEDVIRRQKPGIAKPQRIALHLDPSSRRRLRNLDPNFVRYGLQEVRLPMHREEPPPPPMAPQISACQHYMHCLG